MKSFDIVAETRRRWSAEERGLILEETLSVPVSTVARKHGVAASLVFRWRRQAGMTSKRSREKPAGLFVPVTLPALPAAKAAAAEAGVIEIELAGGRKLRVIGSVEAAALKQVLAALDDR